MADAEHCARGNDQRDGGEHDPRPVRVQQLEKPELAGQGGRGGAGAHARILSCPCRLTGGCAQRQVRGGISHSPPKTPQGGPPQACVGGDFAATPYTAVQCTDLTSDLMNALPLTAGTTLLMVLLMFGTTFMVGGRAIDSGSWRRP